MMSTMERFCLLFLWFPLMLPSATSQCPPSANIEPCSCYSNSVSGQVLYCYGIDTEEELRSILHNPSFPVTSFGEIKIINGLTDIEYGALTALDSLVDLQLHSNALGPALPPGAVAVPATLVSMTLDSNGISEIMPEAITGFSTSAYLSLRSNNLKSFPEETFRPLLERLAEGGGRLDLYGNFGLPCDCSIVWLFLTPGVLDAVDQYYCENFMPITDIDSEALIQSCSRERR
ncbi:leucine-rich repeat LGI family member 3-like [Penaeus indicus]|uniref:leucine-rich repeat LGI family member 3-like n=1 Tax=Penaeus indicus TaxID=29960 RepID=UPI00300C14D7